MVKILVLRNKATIWSPHRLISSQALREIMPKRHCEVSPLRDRRTFETDNEYLQYLAQRRKQQETLREQASTKNSWLHKIHALIIYVRS